MGDYLLDKIISALNETIENNSNINISNRIFIYFSLGFFFILELRKKNNPIVADRKNMALYNSGL